MQGDYPAAGLWGSASLLLSGRWGWQVCAKHKRRVYRGGSCSEFPEDPPLSRTVWCLLKAMGYGLFVTLF